MSQPQRYVELHLHTAYSFLDGADRYPVAHVQECWCIDDEWWRDPIQRHYYRIATAAGAVRTLYHDQITDAWFEQGY